MISVKNLSHSFYIGKKGKEKEIPVLKNISLTIEKGEMASILGRSGSGKSTLLNLISGYMKPDSGTLHIAGKDVTSNSESEWAAFRLQHMGFIFQSFQLIPGLTASENIELPLTLKGLAEPERKEQVREMLSRIGLEQHGGHYPSELSGGQQQRVSIGRALISKPDMILADEPTGSLDTETEQEILQLMKELNREQQITFFIITHDEEVAKISTKQYRLTDGMLEREGASVEI
ncbi:ABC transporter ATP-binding protein [Metabacillus sp. GX 13764]|uniref:ABC transporter ATP-binding protein n=1 Tax=Metabacillus kandeliae TaxID=2900151 RepID=UPI001E3C54B5|nr:ABC transporter ATP-binding protein [Metabacillus kandeliae]MCD7032671.1 ABC transporter ATP-binding protein [Metabacillus kandeliae]